VPVSDGFIEALRDLLHFVPDLRFRRMFGGLGVFSGARMFALAVDDLLYFKTDTVSRAAFEAAGCEPFAFRAKSGGLQPTSYRRAPELAWEDEEEARRWAQLALDAAERAANRKR
jgi:DNA transformation protein and related proteins